MRREREGILVEQSARRPLEAPKATPVPAGRGEASPLDAWSRLWSDASSYWVDAWQRSVLYLDVMRRRGNQYHEHMAEKVPHVLSFTGELVADGRKLQRPVNYGLVRIDPLEDVPVDPKKRPFVVVDPRAGHGPGIGGFKADSEIGVALRAGHPCYFVGFLPKHVPGQTVEDVMRAEAHFLEMVAELHPAAEGKPVVIGNCQAGWQVLMTAATRPELFGPIIVAGSPLSYWAGERGKNPMRYSGGLLGGSWLTALTGDLGNGAFDGAWLVRNFENLNPANTLWTKHYNVYSKIDTEPERYLGFERYWGGYVLLNAEEMQYIVDNLFVGNRLATAELITTDGRRIDLREIRSPIVVFCSKGDNITPPQQALGWITDLYASVDDIRAHGQTIVYCVHDSVGHLGICLSHFPCAGIGWCRRRRISSLISLSLARMRSRRLFRSTRKRPRRLLPQTKVKPRKLKVSGLPSPRWARPAAAWRPNSNRRVLSGWSDSANSCNRVRIASRKRWASVSCSKPTMISSA
jgi:pimeloyl-ACP methyl ester carboxylesterase